MASLVQRAIQKAKRETLRKVSVIGGPVRAAIIGCGGIAPAHIHGYESLGFVRVVAGADLSPSALGKSLEKWPHVLAYRDYQQMLGEVKPDLVSVCTWPQHHAEIVTEVAKTGVKGILCEKPLALRMDEMEQMLSVCRQHGVKLAVGHQFRFHPNFIRAREAIRSGRLGKVETVRATMSGSLANRGPHLVDSVRFLLGDEPVASVTCRCQRQGDRFLRGLPEEDTATGEVVFVGGARLQLAMGDEHSNVLEILVEGTTGTLKVSSSSYGENGTVAKTARIESRPWQFGQFIEWARGKRASYWADDEQSIRSAEIVLALYESARLGRPVEIPLVNGGSVLEELFRDSVQGSGVTSQGSGVRSQESEGKRSPVTSPPIHQSPVVGQESGIRGQGSGVGGQESGVRGQESEGTRLPVTSRPIHQSPVVGQESGVRGQESGVGGQGSGVRGQGLPHPAASVGKPRAQRLAVDGGQRTLKGWFSTAPALGTPELLGVAGVMWSKKLSSTGGGVTRALEEQFAAMYGSPHGVASTSGTAAIHVALGAIDPEPGDEVITTPMSDMGTVIPILLCNCVPVFADVDPITGNITAQTIAEKISPRTRAVIVVHLFGRPAAMGPIMEVCSERGIPVIEDCAQAHLAEYDGKKVGSIGDFGCFSFQSSKQITCGDGGMTLVNNLAYLDRARLYADKGFQRKRPDPTVVFLSPNYRMTELQAAVVQVQLRRLKGLIQARRHTADLLTQRLSDIRAVRLPEAPNGVRCAWWRYTFSVDEESLGVSTLDFVSALRVEGVRTSKEFPPRPLFEHDMIRDRRTYGQSGYPLSGTSFDPPQLADYPGFCEFASRVIPIGWSSQVKRQHVEGIAAAVRKVVRILSSNRAPAERVAMEVEV